MLEWLSQNWGTLLVGAVLLAVVVVLVCHQIKQKKSGQSSCGGNCASCGCGCSHKE